MVRASGVGESFRVNLKSYTKQMRNTQIVNVYKCEGNYRATYSTEAGPREQGPIKLSPV